MNELEKIISRMEPDAALAALARLADTLLSHAGEEARLNFVLSLIGESGTDKLSSMVNL